jgi:hypothetical protein
MEAWVALVVIGLVVWRAVYYVRRGRHSGPW